MAALFDKSFKTLLCSQCSSLALNDLGFTLGSPQNDYFNTYAWEIANDILVQFW